jgi:hypothetical protein
MRDRETPTPVLSTQTARQLPTHVVRAGKPVRTAAKFANVEGPIRPRSLICQRVERNSEGAFYERRVSAEILELLGAVVETGRGGDVVRIKVDVLDTIWTRYDAGDYGAGKAGLGVYSDVADLPLVWLVDDDVVRNASRDLKATHGPQRIILASTRTVSRTY